MSTTEISTLQTPSGDPGHSFGRTLAWIGLSLVCLVLGAAFGVWGLGESMLGPSVTRSRFRALNDRIVGLLEHDSSRLRWNEPSRIEGLRLKSGDGTTLAAGDLEVPALFDSAWHGDHLLPAKASLQLSELHLGFDAAGAVRLLSQLALRSAGNGGSLLLGELLGRAVEYQGHVDRLVLADERGNGVQGELRDTDFKLSWMPQGAAHFELDGTFADSGEVHGQFDWQGMGEGFALGSLVGELTLEGPSAWLGTLLGMPESLPNICGPRVKLTLHLGQKGGAPEGPLAVRLELGQTGAFGMAFDGSFDGRTLTQLPEHTCELQVMHSHLALSALLGMLCDSWPSAVRGLNLAWEEEGLQLWRVRLNNLVSHRVPRRPDLSLVEGFFAASDFDLTVENTTRLSLESREVGANGRLPLGNLDMKWNWSATEGRGQGMLETKSSEARMRGVDAALGFELASNLGELLTPMLRMSWSTERPYPWLQPAVEHLALLSAPTSFFPRIGPAWTADAAAILGKACSIELTAREFQDAPGGASEGWQLQVRGSSLQSEVDLCVAQDRIWSLPGMPGSLVLPVGGKAGVYSVLLAPFLPWFADLRPEPGSPADSVHSVLEYTDLAWKREAGGWKLDQGELSFVPGELEYEIAAPWQVAWLRDDTLLGEEVGETRFQVKGNTVSYELAGFPVGNLQGSIDLASGLVQMTLGQLRPPLSLVLSMDKGKALLGSLKDLRWHDPTQTPDPGR